MKSVDLPHLRSVVLAGHAGCGQDDARRAAPVQAGAVGRGSGKVEDGTSHLDFEPEEQKRRESLSLAVATFEADGTRVTLVDTPGYLDFAAEVVSGFHAADGAILVDGRDGRRRGGPRAGGRARARDEHRRVLLHQQVRLARTPTRRARSTRCAPTFGNKIAPLQLAIGARRAFIGYVDLVHRKAYRSQGGKEVEAPIPAGMADEVARRRDQLLEAAAEADDDVLTKYLEGEEISDHELEACLRKGVKDSILAPVLVGSAATGIGLQALLDAIVRYLPSPADEGAATADRQGRQDRRDRTRTRTGRCSSGSSRPPPTRSSAG